MLWQWCRQCEQGSPGFQPSDLFTTLLCFLCRSQHGTPTVKGRVQTNHLLLASCSNTTSILGRGFYFPLSFPRTFLPSAAYSFSSTYNPSLLVFSPLKSRKEKERVLITFQLTFCHRYSLSICSLLYTGWHILNAPLLLSMPHFLYLCHPGYIDLCACACSVAHHMQLFAMLWTAARQAPLATGLSRQEYWSELPFPSPGNHPDPGIEPASPASALQFFNHWATWEAQHWPVNSAKWTRRDRTHKCQCHSSKKNRNKKGASLFSENSGSAIAVPESWGGRDLGRNPSG